MAGALGFLNALLPFLYGGLVVAYALLLLRDAPAARRAAGPLLAATLVLHVAFVAGSAILLGRHPMANTFDLFTFVALGVAGSYLWVQWRRRNRTTGLFPLLLAFLLQVCASLGRAPTVTVPPILRDSLFGWHALAAAVALSALSVGAVYGGLFLAMYRLMKRDRFDGFAMRIPPMDVLAGMSVHAVEIGFVALTLTVGLGAVLVSRSPEASFADPKVWATFVVWTVHGAALAGRHLRRWGGWRVVTLNLTGYGLLLASLLVVGRVFPTFHRFAG